MSLIQGLGRAVTRAGSSRSALIATGAIAGTAGLVSNTAGAALDATSEAAFSDPEADKYFVGSRGFGPGVMLDAALGPGVAAAGTAGGAGLGALGGAALAGGVGAALRSTEFAKDINIPKNFGDDLPLIGGKKVPILGGQNLFKAGKMGSARGKLVTGGLAAAGALVGAGFGASTYTRSHVNRNRDFYQQSPYNRGSAMQAASTNAYGDMVLGMHNSRRG